MTPPADGTPVEARLSLWDATSIIVGIVVGGGIFATPPDVFANVPGPWAGLGAWLLGGVLSLAGALCFAELAAAYPRSGGEYVYLTRAFGPCVGFLFAWAQLAVIRTAGSIGAMAFVFADEAGQLGGLGGPAVVGAAVLAIAALTVVNALGINPGKRTQNALTVVKLAGLAAIVAAGFGWGQGGTDAPAPRGEHTSFALAMILVLYTYDGWNEAAYVAAEVRHRRRNLPLALLLGAGAVTVLYLLVNAAYLRGLGFNGARSGSSLAPRVLELALGRWAGRVMSVVIMLSALGALNGTILTGSRIYAELGRDYRLFAVLGRWDRGRGAPEWSLAWQAAVSMALVAAVGFGWSGSKGFRELVEDTAPVFWLFLLLTGLALFVLRWRDPGVERPFRVPLYPVVPAVFCGWCGYMLYGSVDYARKAAVAGALVLAAGLPVYWWSRPRKAGG